MADVQYLSEADDVESIRLGIEDTRKIFAQGPLARFKGIEILPGPVFGYAR
jgi:hypothetical protein